MDWKKHNIWKNPCVHHDIKRHLIRLENFQCTAQLVMPQGKSILSLLNGNRKVLYVHERPTMYPLKAYYVPVIELCCQSDFHRTQRGQSHLPTLRNLEFLLIYQCQTWGESLSSIPTLVLRTTTCLDNRHLLPKNPARASCWVLQETPRSSLTSRLIPTTHPPGSRQPFSWVPTIPKFISGLGFCHLINCSFFLWIPFALLYNSLFLIGCRLSE